MLSEDHGSSAKKSVTLILVNNRTQIMLKMEPVGEEQHFQAFEGRVVLEPGWKFQSLLKRSVVGSLNTWKKDHDQT